MTTWLSRPAQSRSMSASPGGGVILPREDADGLGLETVNVSRLHIEVWRVADRNLVRKEISAPEPTPEGGYDYEDGRDGVGDDGRRIWDGDMTVRGTPDQRATTVFPLGAVLKTLEPGAYVVMAQGRVRPARATAQAGHGRGPEPGQGATLGAVHRHGAPGLRRLGRPRRHCAIAEERQGVGRRAHGAGRQGRRRVGVDSQRHGRPRPLRAHAPGRRGRRRAGAGDGLWTGR